MKERETLHSEHPMDSIKRFIFSGEKGGVISSLVKGQKPSIFEFHSFVSLMLNRTTGDPELIIVTTIQYPKLSEGYAIPDKVTDLIIPNEFERFNPQDMGSARREDKERSDGFQTVEKVPLIVLAFGNAVDSQSAEEAAILFSTRGIDPKDALLELKATIRDSKVAFN